MPRDTGDVAATQAIVARVITRVFVPVATITGAVFLVAVFFTGDTGTLALAITALAIGLTGFIQQRYAESRPLAVLVVASVGCAVSVAFIEPAEAVALLPTQALFAFVGAFSLSRRTALYLAIFCASASVWTIWWHLPEATAAELAVGLVVLGATGTAGWRLLAMARDTLAAEAAALSRAVATNEQLLTFEKALAACSRALLLSTGKDALQVALETLRQTVGADRAYLSINVKDHELGSSFQVVNATAKPGLPEDDLLGSAIPWSKYRRAEEQLARGEAFQHLATENSRRDPNGSLLAIPIHSGGEWSGAMAFVDGTRRTNWSADTVRMLQVAAPMLGTAWEREKTRQRLEDLVQSKDRFLASISHELRTPLSAVLGFAEALNSGASHFHSDEATELLELIAQQSRDMADMVEDLLVSARADIGTISVRPQTVFLRAQVETAIVALGSTGATQFEVIGGPGQVWADATRTRQIIRNLLTNATRYGGKEVTIEAKNDGPMTVLAVADSGPGLPTSEWSRIFEPYERAHDRPTQPASIGLGLTVSRQLARAMGGDLVYRADDRGSVFELTLPARPQA